MRETRQPLSNVENGHASRDATRTHGAEEVALDERVRFMDRAMSAVRRCADSLATVTDPAATTRNVMRAVSEVLAPAGVIDVGLVEYRPAKRRICIRSIIRNGVDLPLDEIDFATREWSVDDPALAIPWGQIQHGEFIWGPLSGPAILHPAARAFHIASGARSIAYQPIGRGNEVKGWLAFVLRTEVAPAEAQVSLVKMLAAQIVVVMELERIAVESRDAALARQREAAAEEREAALAGVQRELRSALSALTEQPDVDEFLGRTLLALTQQLGALGADLWIYDAASNAIDLHTLCMDGTTTRRAPPNFTARYPFDAVETADILAGAHRFEDNFVDIVRRLGDESFAFYTGRGVRAVLRVPVAIGSNVIGNIALWKADPVPFSTLHEGLATAMAQLVALAIHTERLHRASVDVAVDRARAEAAERHASELAKVNHALRAAARGLVQESTIEDALPTILRTAIAAASASAGAVIRRVGESSEFAFALIVQDGEELRGSDLAEHPFAVQVREVSRTDPAGYFARIAAGETMWRLADDGKAGPIDESDRWHTPRGQRAVWDIPFFVGNRVSGYLALAFRSEEPPTESVRETVSALATQVGLTLELTRLAEAARRAALAREREQAAEKRAAELAKANEALRCSLVTIAAAPIDRAPALMLLEVARAAGASAIYWIEFDPEARTLEVKIRTANGKVVEGVPEDDPPLFRAPFPADVTPAFEYLCATDSFVKMSADGESELIWPGTNEWHRRHGRTEATAFVARIGSTPLGVIGMGFHDRASMNEREEQLVRSLSNQFALALQMERLARQAERAAIDRALAAELATANEAMRRAVDRLAKEPELESFLGFLLLEISAQLGTDTAAITPYFDDADIFGAGVVFTDGVLSPVAPMAAEVKRSEALFLERLLASEGFALYDVERDAELMWPGAAEFLRARGKRYSLSFAIRVDGRLFGQISLAYAEEPHLRPQQAALVQALSTQAALAIQLTALAQASRNAETARAVAAERNRMAGEIHDSLAQSFTSIALQSESLFSELDPHSPLRGTLAIIQKTARRGLAEARTSVLVLQPVNEAVGELEVALTELAERSTIPGAITCEFRTHTEACALSADVRSAVLRVAQEAVSNALRHSGAKRIDVQFDVHDGEATLTVTDDGLGLREPERRGGLGIPGMRARAESLGGVLTVFAPTEGRGTTVRMRVDCHATQATDS